MRSILVLPVLIISFMVYSCSSGKNEADKDDKDKLCITDSLARMIKFDTAAEIPVNDEVKLSGEVSFDDNKVTKVFPFSSGKVISVYVSLGDRVSKGQTLAVIKSADVAGNYSDLSTGENDVAIAKKQMDNAEALFKNGITSEREYTEASENYKKAVSNANKTREQISINGGGHTSSDGTYRITAPMSGYVVEKNAEPGGFIRTDNTQNLFTVGDISSVWIWANVYETDVSKVKEGYAAQVTTLAYPNRVFKGRVGKANQVLDPQTKVMKVRITLANDSMLLKPEMFANILVLNKETVKMIAIPAEALISDNGKNFVIVYRDRCNPEIRQVDILKTVDGLAYIAKGLQSGEKVISQNQVLVYKTMIGE